MFKKIGVLILGIVAVITLAACTDMGTSVSGYYVAVDINPSIEFIVDEDDFVESFIFLNEDAAILCADLDFTGMNIDDAVELFVQTATEAGYVDPEGEDNAVLITVLGEEDEDEEIKSIRERIRTRLVKHFAKQYINAVVLSEDYTQEDLLLEAEELGVSPGKLKLAYAAMFTDETLVKEELLEMPVKDLLAIVRESHQEDWLEFKEEKIEEFQQRKQDRLDRYQERLERFIENHPELTEEEINEIVENKKAEMREETRERWQERLEKWREHRQNREKCEEGATECETDPQENDETDTQDEQTT